MPAEGPPWAKPSSFYSSSPAAAYFVYQQTSRTSRKSQLVEPLGDRYAVVVNKFTSASGRAGAIGMDSTYDSETAVIQVLKIQAKLARLRETLTEDRAIRQSRSAGGKDRIFCKKNDIIRP